MTVLIGGMRVLNTNFDNSEFGVFTKKPGTLTNDYFTNLLDMDTTWRETDKSEQQFVGSDRKTKKAFFVFLSLPTNCCSDLSVSLHVVSISNKFVK